MKTLTALFIIPWALILNGCRYDCSGVETYQKTAKMITFTDAERSIMQYKRMNRITYLVNDSAEVVFINTEHDSGYNYACKQGMDCPTYSCKQEEERHVYVSANKKIIEVRYFLEGQYSYNTSSYLQLNFFGSNLTMVTSELNAHLLGDSIKIGQSYYDSVYAITSNYKDSFFYKKDYGVVKFIDRQHNKFELVKVE